jgi:endogenous inhibitor of DNA gyrase (YacG/DUF329 family)
MTEQKKLRCPHCGKQTEKAGNEWSPFCSDRCKVQDLSRWLSEEYRVPAHDDDEGDEVGTADAANAQRLH